MTFYIGKNKKAVVSQDLKKFIKKIADNFITFT